MHGLKRFLMYLSALMLVFLMIYTSALGEYEVSALFINVGKADAALFFLGDQRYLIDTGTSGSYAALEKALRYYHVARLDGVIITHTHNDHVGGLEKLLKRSGVEIGALYTGAIFNGADHPAAAAADRIGMTLQWLSAGDVIELENGCAFHVLGPLKQHEDENDNSLVIELITPQGTMLLTADMELEEEEELLTARLIPKADVLKVPHHGRDDATGRALVLRVKPQVAVISTNIDDDRDTADSKVIKRLWDINADVEITQDAKIGILVTLDSGVAAVERIDGE